MRSLGWAIIQHDCVLVKKGKVGHREMHSGETMGRGRLGMEHLEAKERQTSPVTPKARKGQDGRILLDSSTSFRGSVALPTA